MKFESIEQIKKHFGLKTDDPKEIKKLLRQRQVPLHPDKNGGKFATPDDERKYFELDAAIIFIDGLGQESKSLVLLEDAKELVQAALITALAEREQVYQVEKLEARVERRLDKHPKIYENPRIQITGAITAVLTVIMILLNTVLKSPVFDLFSETSELVSASFTLLWGGALVVTSCIGLMTSFRDRRTKSLQNRLKLESFQNQLFEAFALELRQSGTFEKFDKTMFINFLSSIFRESERREELFASIKVEAYPLASHNFSEKFSGLSVDTDIALNIADLVIARALQKGVIRKTDTRSMSDRYEWVWVGETEQG